MASWERHGIVGLRGVVPLHFAIAAGDGPPPYCTDVVCPDAVSANAWPSGAFDW